MGYVAVKPINLSGNSYMPGEMIEEGHVLPSRKRALVRNGCIAEVADVQPMAAVPLAEGEPPNGVITVPIVKDSTGTDTAEVLAVLLTEVDVQHIFAIMQMNVEEAAKEIGTVENENVLIVLHNADSRKGVKDAARKQAEKLNPEETPETES